MIKNFEEFSKPLSKYEGEILKPMVIKVLLAHKGKDNAITSREICHLLQDYKIQDVNVRRIVAYITTRNELNWIISTSQGFYYSTDIKEVQAMIKSLADREEAIKYRKQCLINSLKTTQGDIFLG